MLRQVCKKLKDQFVNLTSVLIIGLIGAAIIVADKTTGMTLFAIALFLVITLLILSADFRRKF